MTFLNKKELKYIAYSIAFALAWFLWILPYLVSKFDGQNPLFQFILFNLGLIFTLQIFFKSVSLGKSINVMNATGIVTLFLALDILMPPYVVTTSGQLISSGPTLILSSSDYAAGLLGEIVGFHGFAVYLFTYVFVPLVLLLISAKLLKNFVRSI